MPSVPRNVVLIAVAMTAACADMAPPSADLGNRIHAIVQICVPRGKQDSQQVVWLRTVVRDGYGGKAQRISGATTAGQPAFETYTAPPRELVGIIVSLASAKDTQFVFYPPRNIPAADWTDWAPAKFSTADRRAEMLLLREADIPGSGDASRGCAESPLPIDAV